ncbi:SDR family NAD(P)-dependent oxidoreductase [Alkalibacillus haloalkaliphilus]|uniref:SDR family NAD(P)-dependent oxidoreductase n=1 Tax=Alkalibacillus haloalkaliphilus TaxID=94136 RepID=UPI000382579F|nr:SDR family NAD(P)-dependent oxidoreductase [Alkalibacillus haloalkaliphilus]
MKCQEYVERTERIPIQFPPQHQPFHPGLEYLMEPRPISETPYYQPSGKLQGKVAIISGGDSGIGRATAYAFAKEGASIVIVYLNEHEDAEETKERVEQIKHLHIFFYNICFGQMFVTFIFNKD